MRKILENVDSVRIGQLQAMLESDGIESFVKNLNQSSLMGEIPFAEVYPELWIMNDGDHEKALRLIDIYKNAAPQQAADWICPSCKSEVPKEIGECWNCGTAPEPKTTDS